VAEIGSTIAGGRVQGALGVITWKDNDDTVPSVTELPDPLLDGEFDWVYHQFFGTNTLSAAVPGLIYNQATPSEFVSSKAMRKCPTGYGLLLVMSLQNVAAAGNPYVDFNGIFRALWKE
jgi:hypothetical protein